MTRPTRSAGWAIATGGCLLAGIGYGHLLAQLHVRMESGEGASCGGTAWFDCAATLLGPYGSLLSLPVGAWAAGWFAASVCVLIIAWRRGRSAQVGCRAACWAVLAAAAAALAYLGISVFLLHTLCPYCLGMDALIACAGACAWRGAGPGWLREDLGRLRWRNLLPAVAAAGLPVAAGLAVLALEQRLGWQPARVVEIRAGLLLPDPVALAACPRLGAADARLRLVLFSDFACPACHRAAGVVEDFVGRHPGEVEVVFINYPLGTACNRDIRRDLHPASCLAARLGIVLQRSGRFWDFHRRMMVGLEPGEVDAPRVWLAARAAAGGELAADAAFADETTARLQRDLAIARHCGIDSTPSFLVGGQIIAGVLSLDDLERLLAAAR